MFERENLLFMTNFILNKRMVDALKAYSKAQEEFASEDVMRKLFTEREVAIAAYHNKWNMTDEEKEVLVNSNKKTSL